MHMPELFARKSRNIRVKKLPGDGLPGETVPVVINYISIRVSERSSSRTDQSRTHFEDAAVRLHRGRRALKRRAFLARAVAVTRLEADYDPALACPAPAR